MQPNRAKLLTRQRRKDRLIDAFNRPIVDIETVEDNLESAQLGTLSHCVVEVSHEVTQHAVPVSWKITVPAALKRQFHEGRIATSQFQSG